MTKLYWFDLMCPENDCIYNGNQETEEIWRQMIRLSDRVVNIWFEV